MNSHGQLETEDLFADLEDEDEIEHNELTVEEDQLLKLSTVMHALSTSSMHDGRSL